MIYNRQYIHSLPLHQYQKDAVNFIYQHHYAGLFLDVGMGKSLITLTALSCIIPKKTLIIAPKAIARSTWTDEIDKWHAPLKYRSLIINNKGKKLTKAKRQLAYQQALDDPKPCLYFINRDLVKDCVDYFGKDNWPFKYIVIDESQSFKSPRSSRFKALRKIRPQVERLIELTGTPTPNGLLDLWSQIYLLDQGESLGETITRYRQQFFNVVKYINNVPVKWKAVKTPTYDAEKDIYQRIKSLVISMKNTKLNLPPVTYVNDKVYLDDDQYKAYQTLIKDKVLDLDSELSVTVDNAAVLSNKLSQIASGSLYIDDDHNFIEVHDEKLKRTKYIIDNTDSPVIVAYHYQSDLKLLTDYFTKNKMNFTVFDNSPEQIRAWNAGEIPILLLQPASSGFGLNLQKGGHTLIWYTLPWSLEQYLQTNGRLARQGQTKPVIIHHLITAKTIDTRILNALKHKDLSQTALMSAVKYTIQTSAKKKV